MRQKLILVGPTYPYRGGNALFMSYLYNALTTEFDVEFINYSVLYPSLLFPGTTQYDESEEHFDRVPSKRMLNSMNPITWAKTASYINSKHPDLIVVDWWQPYFGPCLRGVTSLIKKELKSKILFITENVISHEARWIDGFLTRMGLKHADRFLALSKSVVDTLTPMAKGRKIYRSELPVFGHYSKDEQLDIPAEKEKLGFERDATVLLFFGYVRKYKGLDILIEAFAEMEEKYPDYRLLIAGEFYDNPQPYLQLIDKLGITKKVKVVNKFIPNEQVAAYFTLSEVVVLPYRSATQSGILNIACGYEKPVVITNVGGLSEFVEDGKTGIFVPKADKFEIVKGIERYFSLKDQEDFAGNIAARNEQNSFGGIVDTFKEILADGKKA